jgi:predicted AAA+ superfamily ATPase
MRALETIASYLELLHEAYLVAGLEKFSRRAIRRRAAPRKLITLNNAFLSATHPDGAPDPARDPARFGAWVENACLAAAVNLGQRVTYWREEPLEVDGVLEGSWGSWAVEIKTARREPSIGGRAGVLQTAPELPTARGHTTGR